MFINAIILDSGIQICDIGLHTPPIALGYGTPGLMQTKNTQNENFLSRKIFIL